MDIVTCTLLYINKYEMYSMCKCRQTVETV